MKNDKVPAKGYELLDTRPLAVAEDLIKEMKYTKDQADFIVRAVNNYNTLVQFAKEIRYAFYVENSPKKVKEVMTKYATELGEIIKQAEGK